LFYLYFFSILKLLQFYCYGFFLLDLFILLQISGNIQPEHKEEFERLCRIYNNLKFKAIVITNNYFNNNAIELAKNNYIEILDRDELKKWIKEFPINIEEIDDKFNNRILSLKY